jgi:RecJ-like exonuclease
VTTHHCCACRKDGDVTADFKCPHCGSEDTFDKRLPEWPCERCEKEHSALYKSLCVECQKEVLVVALAEAFGIEDSLQHSDDLVYLNPQEDYGDAAHLVFRGSFLLGETP